MTLAKTEIRSFDWSVLCKYYLLSAVFNNKIRRYLTLLTGERVVEQKSCDHRTTAASLVNSLSSLHVLISLTGVCFRTSLVSHRKLGF